MQPADARVNQSSSICPARHGRSRGRKRGRGTHARGAFCLANRDTALVRNTWHIEWRETADEFGAHLAELELAKLKLIHME